VVSVHIVYGCGARVRALHVDLVHGGYVRPGREGPPRACVDQAVLICVGLLRPRGVHARAGLNAGANACNRAVDPGLRVVGT
jgi:hypothetical protein